MSFDFDYAWQILPVLLQATLVTFQATVGGMVFAMVLGLLLELLRRSASRPSSTRRAGRFPSFVARRC